MILSPLWNRFRSGSRVDFRMPPFQEGFQERNLFRWNFRAVRELLPVEPEVPVEGQPFKELRRGLRPIDTGSFTWNRFRVSVPTLQNRFPSEGISD